MPRPRPSTAESKSTAPTKPTRVLKIIVMGNEKTAAETIIAFAMVHKGDLITAEYLDRVRKRLINTKIFKKVEVLWEAAPEPGWAYLYLDCKDRWSWFIAPMFTYSKGHWGGAIAYGEGNLLGLGKRIGVVARWLSDSQALAVGYQDPGMFGSHFQLKAGLGFERKLLKEYPRILGPVMRDALPIRTMWMNQLFSSLGFGYKALGHLKTGMEYRFGLVAIYDPRCPGQPQGNCADPWEEFSGAYSSPIAFRRPDGTWTGSTYGGAKFWKWKREGILRFRMGYDATLDLFGVKQGWKVDARLDISHPHLGSEFSYVRWQVYGYKAFRFFEAHVLEISGKHEGTSGAPFHRENYMGGSSLPGFVYRQALGNTNTAVRVAYTVPLFHVWWLYFRQVFYYKFAWIFFRDGGKDHPYYTEHAGIRRYHLAFEPGPTDRASFLQSTGTGLRMYAKAVALPLLGVDVAYGFEANAVRFLFYLGKNY